MGRGTWRCNHKVSQTAWWPTSNYSFKICLTHPTSLKPSVRFGESVTAPVLKASLSEERYSVTSFIWKDYRRIPSWKRAHCLRLRYIGGLKTRNSHTTGGLRTPWHSVWVRNRYGRWQRRGKGSGISTEKFKWWGTLAEKGSVIGGSTIHDQEQTHHLSITVKAKHFVCYWHAVQPPKTASWLHEWLLGGSEPWV
jgi:hypothetical protein